MHFFSNTKKCLNFRTKGILNCIQSTCFFIVFIFFICISVSSHKYLSYQVLLFQKKYKFIGQILKLEQNSRLICWLRNQQLLTKSIWYIIYFVFLWYIFGHNMWQKFKSSSIVHICCADTRTRRKETFRGNLTTRLWVVGSIFHGEFAFWNFLWYLTEPIKLETYV